MTLVSRLSVLPRRLLARIKLAVGLAVGGGLSYYAYSEYTRVPPIRRLSSFERKAWPRELEKDGISYHSPVGDVKHCKW